MTESLRATELRREIAELESQRDHLDPAMTEAMLASLRADLAEELGEAPAVPSLPPIRPWAAPTAAPETTPAAPAAPKKPLEKPMKKPAAERLKTKLVRLRRMEAEGNKTKARQIASEIRFLCGAEGLPVPEEAAYRQTHGHAGAPAPSIPGELGAPPAPFGFEAGHGPIAQIRQLRSLALDMLPALQDLSPEAAAEAHDEMDLLAQTLVLGGKFIARRTA